MSSGSQLRGENITAASFFCRCDRVHHAGVAVAGALTEFKPFRSLPRCVQSAWPGSGGHGAPPSGFGASDCGDFALSDCGDFALSDAGDVAPPGTLAFAGLSAGSDDACLAGCSGVGT